MDLNDTSLTEEEQNSGFDESTDETFLLESLPEYPGTLPYAPQSTTENQSVQDAPSEEADNQESSANAAAEQLFSASTAAQTPPTDTPSSSTPLSENAAKSEFQLDDDFINSLKQDLENSARQRMEREAESPTLNKAEEIVNSTETPVDAPEPQVSFDEITPVGETQPVAQESTEDTSLDNFDFDSLSDDIPQDSNTAEPQETSDTEEEDLSDLIDEEEPAPSKKLMWIGVAAAAVAVMALSVGSVWYYFRVLHPPTNASDTTHAAQNHGNVAHHQSEHSNQHHTGEGVDTSAHGESHDSTAGHSNDTSDHGSHQADVHSTESVAHHGETNNNTHENAHNNTQSEAHSATASNHSTKTEKHESPASHGAQSHTTNVASATHGNQHSTANDKNSSASNGEHKSDAHATKTTAAHSAQKPIVKNSHDVANAHQSPEKSHASDTKSSKHGTETNGTKEKHSSSTPHATTEKKSKSIADTHSDKSNSHGSDSHSEKPTKPTKNVEKDIPSSKSTSNYSEETKVTPKPTATPPPANARGIYTVQVYSSPSKDDADEWLDKLRSRGVSNAFVSLQSVRGVTYYRVRFGSYSTRQDADVAAVKLGYASSWVDRIK